MISVLLWLNTYTVYYVYTRRHFDLLSYKTKLLKLIYVTVSYHFSTNDYTGIRFLSESLLSVMYFRLFVYHKAVWHRINIQWVWWYCMHSLFTSLCAVYTHTHIHALKRVMLFTLTAVLSQSPHVQQLHD